MLSSIPYRHSGATLSDVVKVNVFLTDIGDYGELNKIYKRVFEVSLLLTLSIIENKNVFSGVLYHARVGYGAPCQVCGGRGRVAPGRQVGDRVHRGDEIRTDSTAFAWLEQLVAILWYLYFYDGLTESAYGHWTIALLLYEYLIGSRKNTRHRKYIRLQISSRPYLLLDFKKDCPKDVLRSRHNAPHIILSIYSPNNARKQCFEKHNSLKVVHKNASTEVRAGAGSHRDHVTVRNLKQIKMKLSKVIHRHCSNPEIRYGHTGCEGEPVSGIVVSSASRAAVQGGGSVVVVVVVDVVVVDVVVVVAAADFDNAAVVPDSAAGGARGQQSRGHPRGVESVVVEVADGAQESATTTKIDQRYNERNYIK